VNALLVVRDPPDVQKTVVKKAKVSKAIKKVISIGELRKSITDDAMRLELKNQ
jgi:hypothetical protein